MTIFDGRDKFRLNEYRTCFAFNGGGDDKGRDVARVVIIFGGRDNKGCFDDASYGNKQLGR